MLRQIKTNRRGIAENTAMIKKNLLLQKNVYFYKVTTFLPILFVNIIKKSYWFHFEKDFFKSNHSNSNPNRSNIKWQLKYVLRWYRIGNDAVYRPAVSVLSYVSAWSSLSQIGHFTTLLDLSATEIKTAGNFDGLCNTKRY